MTGWPLSCRHKYWKRFSQTGAKGVLIDISVLEMVDSFIGRMLSGMASMAAIMDAFVVIVGMQPAVAITLVELGLEMPGVETALNMEKGIEMLEKRVGTKSQKKLKNNFNRTDHG